MFVQRLVYGNIKESIIKAALLVLCMANAKKQPDGGHANFPLYWNKRGVGENI